MIELHSYIRKKNQYFASILKKLIFRNPGKVQIKPNIIELSLVIFPNVKI